MTGAVRGRTLTLAPAAEAVGLVVGLAEAVVGFGRLVAAGLAGRVLVGLLVPAGRESVLREAAVAVVDLAAAAFKVAVPPGGAGGGPRLVATPVLLVRDGTCLGGVDEGVCEKKSSDMVVVE
jgi:hypothetical protein